MEVGSLTPTSTGYKGWSNGALVHVTTFGKRVVKVTVSRTDQSWTLTYAYNSQGFLSKVVETTNWIERTNVVNKGSAKVNSNGYEKYMKLASAALARGDKYSYGKYVKLAQNAAKTANVSVRQSTVSTKFTPRTSTKSRIYSNYNVDQFGNWINRVCGGYTEIQTLTYDGIFLDKCKWENGVSSSGSLDEIENFYLEALSQKYKDAASVEWNKIFMNKVAQNELTKENLMDYASKTILLAKNNESALNAIRTGILTQMVDQESDYNKLEQLLAIFPMHSVLDGNLRSEIKNKSEKLRKDAAAEFLAKGKSSYEAQSYDVAIDCAKKALKAYSLCYEAKILEENSQYKYLLKKESVNETSDADYEAFLEAYPESQYLQDVKNRRAKYAIANLGRKPTVEQMETVLGYGADSEIVNPLHKKISKTKFIAENGRPIYFAVSYGYKGGNGDEDSYASQQSVGVGVRLGYIQKVLNGYVGAEYQWNLGSVKGVADRVDVDRVAFPFWLKFNVAHILYASVGASYNLLLDAKFKDGSSDKGISTKSSVAPRVAVGLNMSSHVEVEAYYSWEKKLFNEQHVNQDYGFTSFNGPKGFWGVAVRLLFGKSGNSMGF